jgi:hypothetical protein
VIFARVLCKGEETTDLLDNRYAQILELSVLTSHQVISPENPICVVLSLGLSSLTRNAAPPLKNVFALSLPSLQPASLLYLLVV